ncbi:MAG TPA: TaqI-like C-terminal specificity domain-containing protein [Ktedonobacteraceae bacterium]|nr:TaqI-like C-terminal specificity domain-containing protein [Ktedonobacteraceae bacterium]
MRSKSTFVTEDKSEQNLSHLDAPCVYYNSFLSPKIVWGNLATRASFSFDTNGYYVCAPACIVPTEHKWLLALLNSSVSTFFLKSKAIERQGGFIEQKPVYVKQMPIPTISHDIRSILTKKVETLLKHHLEKQEMNKQALEVLLAEYKLSKVTQKLENLLLRGWNELIEELEKQKIKLDLTQKDKLNVWFRIKQSEAKKLGKNMEHLEKEIDALVYKLYNLNEAEIKIIEMNND